MWARVGRRVSHTVLVVWAVGSLAFVLLRLAPGDPLTATLSDPRVPPSVRSAWRTQLALDQPLPQQYARYLGALARGDLGYSWSRQRPVALVIRDALPYSVALMGGALLLSVMAGGALGTWLAMRRGSGAERVSSTFLGLAAGVPDSWLALLMLGVLGAQWHLLPLNGPCDPSTCGQLSGWAAMMDTVRHAVLPVSTLTLLFLIPLARLQRTAVATVLHDDVVRTAVGKGVPASRVLRRHVLRRAARPVLVAVSLALPALAGGSVVIERVFGWPGMGAVLVDAVAMRDYPLVTAAAVLSAAVVSVGGIAADVCLAWLAPHHVWPGDV